MVGGGFAGRRAYQLLASRFDTQLVDAKGYYEYTPANLRCLVEPEHASETVQEHPAGTLVDSVTDVLHTGESATCCSLCKLCIAVLGKSGARVAADVSSGSGALQLLSGKRLSFDFCVLCLGSDYAPPIKAAQNVQVRVLALTASPLAGRACANTPSRQTTCRERRQDFAASHAELGAARSIVIVGAGDVGVELAAEVVGKWRRSKQVGFCCSGTKLPLAKMTSRFS